MEINSKTEEEATGAEDDLGNNKEKGNLSFVMVSKERFHFNVLLKSLVLFMKGMSWKRGKTEGGV